MSDEETGLNARLVHRVHAGLTLDVLLSLGRACGVIFGPSGSGKTTLLRLIAGLERPESGHIRVNHVDWLESSTQLHMPLRKREVGMIFQDDLLFPHLDVATNIRFGLARLARGEADRRVAHVAAMCGVTTLLNRRPETLSGGERQRVGLARALAPKPKLLLCDEPVSAIDLEGRFALLDRLRRAQATEPLPVLYVTHSPAEAVALGDVMFRLEAGKIVDRGAPLDVLARRGSADSESSRLDDVRNLFRGVVTGHSDSRGESFVALSDGPSLVIPFIDRPEGAAVTITIRADDVLLSRGPIAGLSARNVLAGRVARLVPHGTDVEVIAKTGAVEWIVSVVKPAVAALDLREGAEVYLIVKARSCHVLG